MHRAQTEHCRAWGPATAHKNCVPGFTWFYSVQNTMSEALVEHMPCRHHSKIQQTVYNTNDPGAVRLIQAIAAALKYTCSHYMYDKKQCAK